MKNFAFRLEPLYEYRRLIEELRLKDFGEAMKALGYDEDRLKAMKAEHKRSSEEIDGMKERGTTAEDLRLYGAYLDGIKRHISSQEDIIRRCAIELEKRRAEYLSASRDKKVMRSMKERSLKEHDREVSKDDQKAMDDIVTARYKKEGGL